MTQLKDIRLTGRITNGKHLMLDQLAADGTLAARFDGEFDSDDKGSTGCDKIAGTWRKLHGNQNLPFVLRETDGTFGSLDHRYAVAGAEDDNLVHRKAQRFWTAVITGDKRTVSSLVHYPIKVRVAGRLKTVRSPAGLIAEYDAIFSPEFRKAIAAAVPRNMFVRDKGIMLGNGEVWFGANGDVIALTDKTIARQIAIP